jgi:acetylornithine deacetylase/succinyl-diaminopimelate desuccinylase-like protein
MLLLLSSLFSSEMSYGDTAAVLLSKYIQAESINPPGNEQAAAAVLERLFSESAITTEIHDLGDGRVNFMARMEGGDEPPLCLLSHLDVVPAEPERWTHPPFEGVIADGAVWGRGALDMKGMTIIQAVAMLALEKDGVELDRDVILLAVADEEVNNAGIKAAIERWDEIGCSHVINEGGMGLHDVFFEGQPIWPISVGEKGVLWLRMVAEGVPGHGSTPKPDEAPDRLVTALGKIQEREAEPRIHPAMLELFEASGEQRKGIEKFLLTHPRLAGKALMGTLMANPITRAVVTDTVHITGMEGANKPNVVPSEVSALLDCRLLPGTEPDALLAELVELVDDPKIRFEVLSSQRGEVTEWHGDPLYDALVTTLQAETPTAAVGPAISPGFTDSIYLREIGVKAFGMVPFLLTDEELATFHGDDERVRIEELDRGVRVLIETMKAFAG